MATVLHHYEVALDEDNPPVKDLSLTLRPNPGLYLKLRRRDLHSDTHN